MKRRLLILAGSLLLAAVVGFFYIAPAVAARRNGVLHKGPYKVSEAARKVHAGLLIADLHADSLLWGRDLARRGTSGHVDLPRLVEGNVALQAFTLVTKSPRNMNIERNSGDTDNITLLAMAQRWPVASWSSLTERALYQAHRLDDLAKASNGKFTLIRDAAGLESYLSKRMVDPSLTAGFLGVEGAHALDGDLRNLDVLFDAGVRMVAPTHFFDNDLGGSAHGIAKGGLTEKGVAMVQRMEEKRILLDLAHASSQTISDALAIAKRPVVVSHTGVKGTCDNARNLSDDQLRAIAKNGGVVGIGYWSTAVCGTDAAAIARAILYAVKVAGAEHVALGSDFDGAVATPFDVTGLPLVTEALLNAGMSQHDLELVMGKNTLHLLRDVLPPGNVHWMGE
jgi:microsomal dipeptidase-like Zn-dependent dipeptidase